MNNHHQVLAAMGGNLAVAVPDGYNPSFQDGWMALCRVMETPSVRAVGAALEVFGVLSKKDPEASTHLSQVLEGLPDVAFRRFGYLLERVTPRFVDVSVNEKSLKLAKKLLSEQYTHRFPAGLSHFDYVNFLSRIRQSDLRREKDHLHQKWKVLAPVNIWEEYIK